MTQSGLRFLRFADMDTEDKQDVPRDDGLREAVDKLPPRQREVISRRFFGQASHSEIALEMGCTKQTVINLEKQGLERLRKYVERR